MILTKNNIWLNKGFLQAFEAQAVIQFIFNQPNFFCHIDFYHGKVIPLILRVKKLKKQYRIVIMITGWKRVQYFCIGKHSMAWLVSIGGHVFRFIAKIGIIPCYGFKFKVVRKALQTVLCRKEGWQVNSGKIKIYTKRIIEQKYLIVHIWSRKYHFYPPNPNHHTSLYIFQYQKR